MTNAPSLSEAERELAILHLAEDPNDSFLLREELLECGIAGQVARSADGDELARALLQQRFDLLVVDLPLPERVDTQVLDELASSHPELAVVFRWGSSGCWTTEDPSEQLGRSVRRALAARWERKEGRVLDRLVRQQQASSSSPSAARRTSTPPCATSPPRSRARWASRA